MVVNMAKGLDRERFIPFVCCLNGKGPLADELEQVGIKVFALNKKPGIDFGIIGKLVNVIKENQISVVHSHLWGANFWGRIAAQRAGVPVIIAQEHNSDTWKSWLHVMLDRRLSKSTDVVVAVAQSVKEFYVAKGIPAEKIEVIYNGIEIASVASLPRNDTLKVLPRNDTLKVLPRNDTLKVLPRNGSLRKELGIREDEVILAIIGRLVEQKGHEYLFKALSMLNGACKVKLLVVGEGKLREKLQLLVASYQLSDKVKFLGARNDIPKLLKEVDMLVMPSLREGLPMIALEAMREGVPVIAASVGGIPEVVKDNETGILVAPKDPLQLKDALIRCLSDGQLREHITRNARKLVEDKFSVEAMVGRTEELYRRLLK